MSVDGATGASDGESASPATRRPCHTLRPTSREPGLGFEAGALQQAHDRTHAGERGLNEVRTHQSRHPEPVLAVLDGEQHRAEDDDANDKQDDAFESHVSAPRSMDHDGAKGARPCACRQYRKGSFRSLWRRFAAALAGAQAATLPACTFGAQLVLAMPCERFYSRRGHTSSQSARTRSPAGIGCARRADCPDHACIRSTSLALTAASRIACVRPRCTG